MAQHSLIKRLMALLLIMAVILAALAAYFFQARQARQARSHNPADDVSYMKLGTFVRLKVCADDSLIRAAAHKSALAAIDRVDRLMSTYRDDSELSAVNDTAYLKPIPVSREVYDLLAKAMVYSRMTDGAFDITVTPLLEVWKQAERENQLPRQEKTTEAIAKTGCDKVLLSDGPKCAVRFTKEGVRLNVDAIAKGYAVDQALEAIRSAGATAGLVDIGGEIACFGKDWVIGIQDPFSATNADPLSQTPRWVLRLNDCAVATSGNYRRYMRIAGEKYSHIIDPRSGRPADKLPSVTVIAPKAIDADALATAISVIGPKKGLELIESIQNTEAFLVSGTSKNPKILQSSGLSKYQAE